jgi:hypothetical protein
MSVLLSGSHFAIYFLGIPGYSSQKTDLENYVFALLLWPFLTTILLRATQNAWIQRHVCFLSRWTLALSNTSDFGSKTLSDDECLVCSLGRLYESYLGTINMNTLAIAFIHIITTNRSREAHSHRHDVPVAVMPKDALRGTIAR